MAFSVSWVGEAVSLCSGESWVGEATLPASAMSLTVKPLPMFGRLALTNTQVTAPQKNYLGKLSVEVVQDGTDKVQYIKFKH